MTTLTPTPTQTRYLSFIQTYIEGFGYPPAESEISKAMKVSAPSVNQMMKVLEQKGFIQRKPGVPRSIEVLLPSESLPPWNKSITSTRRVWTRVVPPSSFRPKTGRDLVYRFKITLKGTQPPIWRRIETKDVSLQKLHELIQTAMGWENSHLHCFQIGNMRYADPRLMDDGFDELGETSYARVRVSNLVTKHGPKMKLNYLYDYGDSWAHTIQLEKVAEADAHGPYPRCIDGALACPPEDVGGVWGFVDFVETITNPKHEQHDEYLEWHGPFDPEKFDPVVATRRMKQGLSAW